MLLRVDEFPHARVLDEPRYGLDAFERFHAVLAEAGCRTCLRCCRGRRMTT